MDISILGRTPLSLGKPSIAVAKVPHTILTGIPVFSNLNSLFASLQVNAFFISITEP